MCLQLNINEVYDNLVLPACAYALLGKAGVILIASSLFMAVTSGGAGEMLAVSSLFTFDVWREYIRPQVTCSSPQTVRHGVMQCTACSQPVRDYYFLLNLHVWLKAFLPCLIKAL